MCRSRVSLGFIPHSCALVAYKVALRTAAAHEHERSPRPWPCRACLGCPCHAPAQHHAPRSNNHAASYCQLCLASVRSKTSRAQGGGSARRLPLLQPLPAAYGVVNLSPSACYRARAVAGPHNVRKPALLHRHGRVQHWSRTRMGIHHSAANMASPSASVLRFASTRPRTPSHAGAGGEAREVAAHADLVLPLSGGWSLAVGRWQPDHRGRGQRERAARRRWSADSRRRHQVCVRATWGIGPAGAAGGSLLVGVAVRPAAVHIRLGLSAAERLRPP